jgi:glycosyltransferase involved in cell wall biosynthesis
MRTYWSAHALAERGHEVHVVTNAKEALAPLRMHMRRQDWKRCEAEYAKGSVSVHWTDPTDASQAYIPMASPFVSKLAAMAARVHSERPFDVIYAHYLEPYGVAAYLAAQITHVPYVARMAGSDSGRLWRHPQLEPLYDHVLRSAALVIAVGMIAQRAIDRGVRPDRIAAEGSFAGPEGLFCPDGPSLDLAALRREVEPDREIRDLMWGEFSGQLPYFGIYGKLGETKGSFALLAAMQRLKQAGFEIGLVAMAHGRPTVESQFRSRVQELGIADRVLQIPFLPHWRVPEFLRSCLAVCCLEQDFPIMAHTPVIAREVLTCGTCLVGSTEMIRKLPDHTRLANGYGCVAIEDVHDIENLSGRLAAIAGDPEPVASVAARGRAFARALEPNHRCPDALESLLKAAARRRAPAKRKQLAANAATESDRRFPITQAAARALASTNPIESRPGEPIDLPFARDTLAAAERSIARGEWSLRGAAMAIRLEIMVAEAEEAHDTESWQGRDPLYRLRTKRWALAEDDLALLVPVRDPQLRMMIVDVSELQDHRAEPGFSGAPAPRLHHVVAFAHANGGGREPLFISDEAARILELSDGTRTALEISAEAESQNRSARDRSGLKLIEELFVSGLLWLQEAKLDRLESMRPEPVQSM